MIAWTHLLVLLDFFESDNDGLYTLFMIAAVGFALVLIVMVTRQSRASDRRVKETAESSLAATAAPDDAASPGANA